MNQGARTGFFVAAALAAIGLAFATYPRPNFTLDSLEGKPLFDKLADLEPKSLTSLEVVTFHEDQAAKESFRVEQKNNRWVLPKHNDYPADATQHMVDAAKAIVALTIEKEVSDKPGMHAEYGVLDPESSTLKPGDTGVGKRIAVGVQDKTVAEFIVGKTPVDKNDYRYVRKVGDNKVFLAKLDPNAWSTKFGDWIEKDLLKIDTFSIKELVLRDYNLEFAQTGDGRVAVTGVNERGEATLDFDDSKSEWKLTKYRTLDDKGEPIEQPLTSKEEINPAPLNELKSALADLKIIDVEKKPIGLEGTLEEFLAKGGARSLAERGFFPYRTQSGKVDILSNDGEIVVRLKTGVEYVLRFGTIAGKADEPGEKKETTAKKDDNSTALSRFIFVMAQVNENLIPKPQLEALPTAEPAKPEEKQPDEKKADEKPPAENKKEGDPKDDNGSKKSADEKADAETEKGKPAPETKGDDKAADGPPKKEGDVKPDADKKDVEAERKRIEAENKQKQDEYNDKLKKAQDKVKDLNKRFGEWYYVVADSEYKKIHLSRKDFVKAKEVPKGQGDGAEDFDQLKKGIEGKPEEKK